MSTSFNRTRPRVLVAGAALALLALTGCGAEAEPTATTTMVTSTPSKTETATETATESETLDARSKGIQDFIALPGSGALANATCDAFDEGESYATIEAAVSSNLDLSGEAFTVGDVLAILVLTGCPEYIDQVPTP